MMRRLLLSVGSCGCGRWLLVGITPSLASSDPSLLPIKLNVHGLFPPSTLLSVLLLVPAQVVPLAFSCYFTFSFPSPPQSLFHHRFLALAHRARYSPWYQIVRQAPGLAPGASEYLQALSHVYSDDAAYEMACLIFPSSFFLMCTPSSDIRQNLRPKLLGTYMCSFQ